METKLESIVFPTCSVSLHAYNPPWAVVREGRASRARKEGEMDMVGTQAGWYDVIDGVGHPNSTLFSDARTH